MPDYRGIMFREWFCGHSLPWILQWVKINIEYYMESAPVRCLHTSCGVSWSEIEQVSVANEWDFWYETTSV